MIHSTHQAESCKFIPENLFKPLEKTAVFGSQTLQVFEASVQISSRVFLPDDIRGAEKWFPVTILTSLQPSVNCIFTKADPRCFLLYYFAVEYKSSYFHDKLY